MQVQTYKQFEWRMKRVARMHGTVAAAVGICFYFYDIYRYVMMMFIVVFNMLFVSSAY